MSHCRASCHSAEVLEVTSPHEWVCLEVFRQFPVYFFVRQLGEVEPAFETFYFQYPKFIFQCLIGTKLDRFQFYFGSLSFGVYRYGFRTGQARAKITDTVQQLADLMTISRSSLYNKIKIITGLGVNDYINRLRIEKAISLLTNTNLNINEISSEVGFTYPRYFSSTFKQMKGMTPKQFREENRMK